MYSCVRSSQSPATDFCCLLLPGIYFHIPGFPHGGKQIRTTQKISYEIWDLKWSMFNLFLCIDYRVNTSPYLPANPNFLLNTSLAKCSLQKASLNASSSPAYCCLTCIVPTPSPPQFHNGKFAPGIALPHSTSEFRLRKKWPRREFSRKLDSINLPATNCSNLSNLKIVTEGSGRNVHRGRGKWVCRRTMDMKTSTTERQNDAHGSEGPVGRNVWGPELSHPLSDIV